MKILLVNAFSDTKLGREEFHLFFGIFENIIEESRDDFDGGNRDIMIRRIDDLADIVLDWEHSILAHNAGKLAQNFDKIDMICVCGNMKILPWMPICFDLIVLMHMAHLLNKPMLTCGSAAYTAVYTCATQGARFHMVNQPLGDSLEHLKKFPYYYKGTKAYPCGWLDNETGDIFSYNLQTRSWKGICNAGIYRLANSGTPTPYRHRPIKKKNGMEGRMEHLLPETPGDRDCQVLIRNAHMQHYALKQFTTPAFVAVMMDDWHFNIDGGLPLHTSLEVLADGPHGPIIFQHKNSLHLACAVVASYVCEPTKNIIREYLKHTMRRIVENTSGTIPLYHFLFSVNSTGLTDSSKLSLPMAPPLNSLSVRSSLQGGPVRHPTPAEKERVEPPDPTEAMKAMLGSSRKKGAAPAPPPQQTRNPAQAREVRLRRVFQRCYGECSTQTMCGIVATSNTINIPVPISVEIMDTTAEQRLALEQYRRAVSPPSRPHSSQLMNATRKKQISADDLDDDQNHDKPQSGGGQGEEPQIMVVGSRGSLIRGNSANNISAQPSNRSLLEATRDDRPHSAREMSRNVSREEGMRLNWKTNWEDARYPPDPVPLVETTKPPNIIFSTEKAVASSFLPMQHPRNAGSHSSIFNHSTKSNSVAADVATGGIGGTASVRVEHVKPKTSKPYSTKALFDQIVQQEKSNKEYLGVFRGGYLSPYEKERKDYIDNRKRFLAGTFRTHHGLASEMALRQDGGVRAHGAFPAPIDYHKDNTYTLHGDWTPTADLFPKHKEPISDTVERAANFKPTSRAHPSYKKSPRGTTSLQRTKN